MRVSYYLGLCSQREAPVLHTTGRKYLHSDKKMIYEKQQKLSEINCNQGKTWH